MRIQSLSRPETAPPAAVPLTRIDLRAAAAPARPQPVERLGDLLLAQGVLTAEQAEQVARAQRGTGARFGDTAVALGFVDRRSVDAALARQFNFAISARDASVLDPALVTAHGQRDRASELIRSLRGKLWAQLQREGGADAVTILSMTGIVGRRVIAGNLAVAFAQAGTRTLLIDADMRNPALHRLFGIANNSGLSTFLAGRQSDPDIFAIDEISNLAFHPAGPMPPNPAELLVRLGSALPRLKAAAAADMVLLNAPPFDAADDGYLVAAAAPAVLMVTRRHFTRARGLAATARRLQAANIRIVGSVLNVA